MTPTKDQIEQAEKLFPTPGMTNWYLTKFPKKQAVRVEIFLFVVGFVMTALGNKKKENYDNSEHGYYIATFAATALFVFVLAGIGAVHSISWVKMRIVERKRAKWIGCTLQEYWNAMK
jgi:hypothetical protein